jgi:CheY-like chemotaxis protein
MKRVLIVDDDRSLSRLLALNLEQTGRYAVRVENWPEDALAAAREFKPDLAFLDVMMPRMVGGDVASCLRADPQFKTLPIVFLTAAVTKQRVEEHGGSISGFHFLAKPVSTEEVLACLNQHLGREERGGDTPCERGGGLSESVEGSAH